MAEVNLKPVMDAVNTVKPVMDAFGGAKYCSSCGKEVHKCECGDQTITFSICIPRGLLNLANLIPRIQIASDKCHKCGHTPNRCVCEEREKVKVE